jgi:hypothetical protein
VLARKFIRLRQPPAGYGLRMPMDAGTGAGHVRIMRWR